MTMSNPGPSDAKTSQQKNRIIWILALALIGTWVYLLIDQQSKKDTIQRQQADITTLDASKVRLQQAFDESLTRLDSLGNFNDSLRQQVSGLQQDIVSKKAEIRKILNDRNAKKADLEKARLLIADLNDRILNLDKEVARLTGENKKLSTDNAQLQQEKSELESDLGKTQVEKEALASIVDQGSTFVASNIEVQAVDERRSGKERSTSNAKRVDKLVVSFDVENRIAKSGPTPITLIVTTPEGQVINAAENQFETREDGKKSFTAQLEVNYTKGSKQNVQYPVRGSFASGNYKIEIYQNGYKIGEAARPLK